MKKLLVGFLLAGLAGPALAQEAIDPNPANVQQNFVAIQQSRLLMTYRVPSVASTISHKVGMPMDARLMEAWVTLETAGIATIPLRLYVSLSRKGASAIIPLCTVVLAGSAQLGTDPANASCNSGQQIREGDALILSPQPNSTQSAVVANVTLRLAN